MWVALVLVAGLVWCLHLRFSHAGRLLAKIPGPKDIPVLGNAYCVLLPPDELFTFLRDVYKSFGGIIKIYAFNNRCVNIYEPEDVETILSTTRFNVKQIPYTFLKPWLTDGLILSEGSKWQHRRKMLTPAFHFNILRRYTHSFNEQTDQLLNIVKKEVGKDRTEFMPLLTKTALKIVAETAMGMSIGEGQDSIINTYFNAVKIVGDCAVKRICRAWYHLDVIFNFSQIKRTQTKALKDIHSFTDQVVRERKADFKKNNVEKCIDNDVYGSKGRLSMLDLLLQNEKERKIDLKGIREEVDNFMFAGHDTIAVALNFMIMRIANEPEIQENIYAELREIFGDSQRPPTMDDLNEMKYLKCCIMESLRLYPSVPFISRYLSEDVVLSGYIAPAKSTVNIHIYDIHHRADIYPDPEKFIPERFLPENSIKRHPYAYIPFSAGPRNCIGQKFAMLEMKTVMSGLLRKFRLEPVTKPEDIRFTAGMLLDTTHPVYVRICERH